MPEDVVRIGLLFKNCYFNVQFSFYESSNLKYDGIVRNPIDPERVKQMAEIIRGMG